MIKLAQLYKAGMFVYVYWLRAFFETPIAQRKVIELEDKYAHSDSESDSDIFQGIGRNEWKVAPYVPEEDLLRDDIIDAGIALGLYYNSSQEAVPYLCTISSDMSEPIDRIKCTVFPVDRLFRHSKVVLYSNRILFWLPTLLENKNIVLGLRTEKRNRPKYISCLVV